MQLDLQALTSSPMPFAQPAFFCEKITRDPTDAAEEELWFIFKGSKLLVDQEGQPLQAKEIPLKHSVYLGILDHLHVYAGEAIDVPLPDQVSWENLTSLVGRLSETFLALAAKASQLILWERTHQFCGQCGRQTMKKEQERAKQCPSCRLLFFPKICPVILTLIQKDDEILLARPADSAIEFYSALAGFVETGETLEQCLKREVFEEVGLTVRDLRYFGSQPLLKIYTNLLIIL